MVDLGKRGVDDAGRHEVGERLLQPDVVEPLHRHEVAEPHVRRLVGDEAGAAEMGVLRGALVEQQRVLVVEDGAGMLHAAVLKRRHEHEIELLERERDARVVLEPGQRGGVEVEDGVGVAQQAVAVGLAVVHGHPPPVAFRRLHLELPGREGEQVAADGRRFGEVEPRPAVADLMGGERPVGHRAPPGRHVEAQPEPRLQVRLVEQRQGDARPVGHEQRVEEVVPAVERSVPGGEVDRHRQRAGGQAPCAPRHDDVLVPRLEGRRLAADAHGVHAAGRLGEVEDDRSRLRQGEGRLHPSADGLRAGLRYHEVDVVAQVGDGRGAPRGELVRHAGIHVDHRLTRAPGRHGQEQDARGRQRTGRGRGENPSNLTPADHRIPPSPRSRSWHVGRVLARPIVPREAPVSGPAHFRR